MSQPIIEPTRWGDLKQEFLEYKKTSTRPDTVLAYKISLDQFDVVAKGKYGHEISSGVLQDFAKKRREGGASVATCNKDLRHVRAALNWAAGRRTIPNAPSFKGVFLREDRKAPIVVARGNREKIFAALDQPDLPLQLRSAAWWRVCLLILADLGVRRGEAVGLRWGAVDLKRREVTICAESSKGRRYRTLPLTTELLAELAKWKMANGNPGDDQPVLPWEKPALRRFYDDWTTIITAAGLPKDIKPIPKHFRSTCGSEMIEAGVPTIVVKDMLGHASVTTTESHYINTGSSLRAASDARVAHMSQAEGKKRPKKGRKAS